MLVDNAVYNRQRGTVLLGVLRYRFNYIDSSAVRNNQLRRDTSAPSRLFNVAGRSGSPYLLGEVVVAAALVDSSSTGTVSFRLDPASIFTNTGAALSSASIDFGDGGAVQTCTPGQILTVSYSTVGRITVTLTQMQIFSSTYAQRSGAPAIYTYPNPANETVDVFYGDESETRLGTASQPFPANSTPRLYDAQGTIRRQMQVATATSKITLPVAALPAGLYHLVVEKNGQALHRHIEVKH